MPEVRLRATLAGPVALRALAGQTAGSVRAVFERSAYIALGPWLVCVGPEALGAGPLNILITPQWPRHEAWTSAARPGMAAELRNAALHLAGVAAIDLSACAPWQAEPFPAWRRESLSRGFAACIRAASNPPHEGLARLLLGGEPQTAVLKAARLPALTLARLIADRSTEDAEALLPLLGLGPGLTPSGDDLIGGAFVALSALGEADLRDALWRALAPFAATRTTDISHAHLAAAAEGYGSAALHALLAAILGGDDGAIPARLAAVAAIGHTSGWDAITGALIALRACAEAEQMAH